MYVLCPLCVFAQFSGKGSGTTDDPYQITNADELFEVRNSLSASYKLMNDVDLTEWIAENNPTQGWSPIGDENSPFTGFFDGNQKMIKGLYIKRPSTDNIGLFGYIAYPCIIENLYLKSPIVVGKNNCGALAGFCHGGTGYNFKSFMEIRSVNVIMPQVQGNSHIGGLMGYARRVMTRKNSITYPRIEGNVNIGGIVGACYDYNGDNYNIEADSICNNIVAGGRIEGVKNIGGITGYSGYIYSGYASNNFMDIHIYKNICSSSIKGEECVGGVCGKINSVYSYKYSYNTSNSSNSRSEDGEGCCHHINDNCFKGKIEGQYHVAGIIGGLFCELNLASNRAIYVDTYAQPYIDIYRNICSGNIFSQENVSGILGEIPTTVYINGVVSSRTIIAPNKDVLAYNVFCGDTLSTQYTNSNLFRISNHEGSSNYALSTASLFVDNQPFTIEEDNAQQGTGYGKKTLMKQSTYEGLGFDFSNNWAIVEGETYPYNIKQCRPATVTSFKSGTSGTIEGTAIGKSSNCQGSVYVAIGENFFEGDVTNGRWTVQLGNVAEGTEAKVAVMVDGMMPSILTTALAEKGSNMPSTDDIVNTDISSLSDAIYAETRTALKGGNGTLTISMKNAQATSAYSFDLVLPEGVTVDSYTLSSRHNGHAETMNRNETTGIYSFAVLSLQSKEIKDNDGVIWTLKLNVADNVEAGDYAVKIQNAKYSLTSGSTSVVLPEVTSLLTIEDYIKGDANGDSTVDIADAVCIVNHVVGKDAPTFVEASSDANGDGVVDIADAVRIVNLVVGKIETLAPVFHFSLPEPQ